MLAWISQNLATIIIAVVIFGLMGLALWRIIQNRRSGGCGGCSGGCSSCSNCPSCSCETDIAEQPPRS